MFTLWPDLPPAPKVLLLGMALVALDNPSDKGRPARVFFGGEDTLCEYSGRSRSATYRALSLLREAGAVEVIDAGRNRHRAVYKLVLTAEEVEAKRPNLGTGKGPNLETEGSEGSDRKGPTNATPRNHGGRDQESRGGDISSKVPVSPAAVDDDADPDSTLTDAERTERHNRQLIETHGLIPALRLIEGGKTA
ncbi:hypothetical protein [Isoptericola halotolerans]|uniref:DNA-binding transcriptional ArsR family regulator n=1 Tax=Isoptericola halotolerans TaxID=300560 RepID=A0ABX2A8F1_9MICO|nr:hypothetical protein [Isoptericola halotolerans]NOV98195.1 DNA-binding transcriptional ArsR family regulator [Isoptericola halotolerans]